MSPTTFVQRLSQSYYISSYLITLPQCSHRKANSVIPQLFYHLKVAMNDVKAFLTTLINMIDYTVSYMQCSRPKFERILKCIHLPLLHKKMLTEFPCLF